ncbi:LysR family transcriptional regulator [Paenirhodobacter populi]|uniref:LysR family transcriptional regulator n=1 Tax=Paenirhodobacter populi TaxID=2306993 RepID=UPI000FE32C1B|nr:LysR family transcriptional regulator [Sinirhodobacter populi]RWR07089.1 LysR family transcriptional regulator [Sinirhodobacter populi]
MTDAVQSWDHWRSFLAVVAEGSLSGAARALMLTQPTVGRHVDALEAGLGAALFTRSRGGLNPTELALSLVPEAQAMAMAADNLLRTASGERNAPRGTVRLTANDIVGTFILPPMLAAFRESHPAITIELSLSTRNENLLRREADIAVRMVRPAQEAIVARHLGAVRIGLFAHRRYAATHGLPQSAEELFSHPIVGIDQEEALIAGLSFGGHALSRDDFAFRCDSAVAQLMAVKAGFGIGACHLGLAAGEPELVRVLPGTVEFGYEMWLAMHEDLRDTRRVRLLFDHLAEGLRAYAGRR